MRGGADSAANAGWPGRTAVPETATAKANRRRSLDQYTTAPARANQGDRRLRGADVQVQEPSDTGTVPIDVSDSGGLQGSDGARSAGSSELASQVIRLPLNRR